MSASSLEHIHAWRRNMDDAISLKEGQFVFWYGIWMEAYLTWRLMSLVPVSSMTCILLLASLYFPGRGKKQEVFSCRERTTCSTCSVGTGTVHETETRRRIGFKLTFPELGTKSNHISADRLETGSKRSWSENEVVPNVFNALVNGKLVGERDTSSKRSSPVGSHWKLATCFTLDSDKIVNSRVASKSISGCVFLYETERFPLCPSGKFLTSTNSKSTWKKGRPEQKILRTIWELFFPKKNEKEAELWAQHFARQNSEIKTQEQGLILINKIPLFLKHVQNSKRNINRHYFIFPDNFENYKYNNENYSNMHICQELISMADDTTSGWPKWVNIWDEWTWIKREPIVIGYVQD